MVFVSRKWMATVDVENTSDRKARNLKKSINFIIISFSFLLLLLLKESKIEVLKAMKTVAQKD